MTIPDSAWEETGDVSNDGGHPNDDWTRLYTSVMIAGCTMHLSAFAVQEGEDDVYEAVNDAFDEDVEAIFTLNGDAPKTVEIRGREYFLVAFPFAA